MFEQPYHKTISFMPLKYNYGKTGSVLRRGVVGFF